jgi:hypothetical protein
MAPRGAIVDARVPQVSGNALDAGAHMWHYIVKVLLTVSMVVAISEIAKRSTFWGAALASLPLTSLLAFVWLYLETGDTQQVAALSAGIFWLVLPSLLLFVVLTFVLRSGWGLWAGLGVACVLTAVAYAAMVWCLERFGIRI